MKTHIEQEFAPLDQTLQDLNLLYQPDLTAEHYHMLSATIDTFKKRSIHHFGQARSISASFIPIKADFRHEIELFQLGLIAVVQALTHDPLSNPYQDSVQNLADQICLNDLIAHFEPSLEKNQAKWLSLILKSGILALRQNKLGTLSSNFLKKNGALLSDRKSTSNSHSVHQDMFAAIDKALVKLQVFTRRKEQEVKKLLRPDNSCDTKSYILIPFQSKILDGAISHGYHKIESHFIQAQQTIYDQYPTQMTCDTPKVLTETADLSSYYQLLEQVHDFQIVVLGYYKERKPNFNAKNLEFTAECVTHLIEKISQNNLTEGDISKFEEHLQQYNTCSRFMRLCTTLVGVLLGFVAGAALGAAAGTTGLVVAGVLGGCLGFKGAQRLTLWYSNQYIRTQNSALTHHAEDFTQAVRSMIKL